MNQGLYLEETIISVLGQGYPNLEYFIIDGGSTDESMEVIKKYERKLKFWCSEKDNGQSHALNKGFSLATGEIFAWINSDDVLMPQSLFIMAKQYMLSARSDIFFFGDCIHFEESLSGVISYGSDVVANAKKFDLNICDYIIQPSSFWSKEIWDKVGPLNENLHYAFDWEWFLRVKKKKINFMPFSKVLSLYRIHNSQKTGTGGIKRRNEIEEIYQRFSKPEIAELYKSIIADLDINGQRTIIDRVKRNLILRLNPRLNSISFLKKLNKKYNYYSDNILEGVYNMK